jgi:3-oxoacyl-[acyl-carrier protein] reductase
MFDVSQKKVLITGATGGIGRKIAEQFLLLHSEVFLTGTSKDKLLELKEELQDKITNSRIHIFELDLRDFEKTENMVKVSQEVMGRLDIVITNAGITKDSLAIRMKNEEWDVVIDVNLKASFIINRQAIKIMLKQKYGRIINIASVVALTGNLGQVNYVASKAGIIGMTKSLAAEVSTRNITVNAVAPGFIKTQMTDVMSQESKDSIMLKIPMGRYGLPEDVASACVFLASDEANYITGHTLNVNGGMFMG